jgi:tight adherence protein B
VFDSLDPLYVFYAALVGAVLIFADTFYLMTATATSYRSNVNRRLGQLDKAADRTEAVIELRRERGLGGIGGHLAAATWARRLLMQSGMPHPAWKIAAAAGVAATVGLTSGYFWHGVLTALGGLLGGGLALPLFVLIHMRNKRRALFTAQFSEALDIVVRSLRAGHPVPAAIRMVAREMADPIGSEFGMVEDEIVYGLDIETAMRNMLERVGQEDLPLFVTSVSIQASTGGNLAEILSSLTEVVRQRAKMRRKIHAISAEGRISAIILTAAPVGLFFLINTVTPNFYGGHWDHPWMTWGLGGAAAWMGVGNLIMRRMINFKV